MQYIVVRALVMEIIFSFHIPSVRKDEPPPSLISRIYKLYLRVSRNYRILLCTMAKKVMKGEKCEDTYARSVSKIFGKGIRKKADFASKLER